MKTLAIWIVLIVAVVLILDSCPAAIDQTFNDPPSIQGVDKEEIIRNLQAPRR